MGCYQVSGQIYILGLMDILTVCIEYWFRVWTLVITKLRQGIS